MTDEFLINILKQYREKPTLINEIEIVEEAAWLDEALGMAIKALDQEPKTGHWIEVTNGRGGHECDICHKYAPSYQDGDEYLTNYCPNCGAKMTEWSDKE